MDQTMRVFPILDLLNCLSNVIMMVRVCFSVCVLGIVSFPTHPPIYA